MFGQRVPNDLRIKSNEYLSTDKIKEYLDKQEKFGDAMMDQFED